MTSASTGTPPSVARGRGRPRSEAVGEAIRAAVRTILATEGYEGLTFEAVAERAGVARTTLYRRYADRAAIVVEASAALAAAIPDTDTGSLEGDLTAAIEGVTQTFLNPATAGMLAAVVGQMGRDPALAEAMRVAVVARRMAVMEAIFRRAVIRGEIPAATDWWLSAQRLVGPVMMRVLLTREPVDAAFIARLVAFEVRAIRSAAAPSA